MQKENPSRELFQEALAVFGAPIKVSKDKVGLCSGVFMNLQDTRTEPTFQRGHKDHSAAKGEKFYEPLQFGTQIHSHEESDENS